MHDFIFLILMSGLQVGCLYAVMALGYYMIVNATGILNFAQGEWVMLSAVFGVVLIGLGVPYWIALILSLVFAVLAALLAENLIIKPLQRRGASIDTLVVALLGLLIVVRYTTGVLFGREQRSLDSPFPGFVEIDGAGQFDYQTILIFASTAVIFTVTWWFMRHTWFGRSFRIASIDAIGAQVCGVNPRKIRMFAFAIGGLLAALVGWLYAPIYAAGYMMGASIGIKGFVCLIIGGMTSMFGGLAGGLLLGILEVTIAFYAGSIYSEAIAFALLMLFLFVRPNGLITSR